MKKSILHVMLIGLFSSAVLVFSGCNSESDSTPPDIEVVVPDAPVEELILPADSVGEGSEPKDSKPFGGAVREDKDAEGHTHGDDDPDHKH